MTREEEGFTEILHIFTLCEVLRKFYHFPQNN